MKYMKNWCRKGEREREIISFTIFLLKDLEKSLAAQKALLQQQQELEAESAEMQDFLQEEKATLADALKDAESEVHFLNIRFS